VVRKRLRRKRSASKSMHGRAETVVAILILIVFSLFLPYVRGNSTYVDVTVSEAKTMIDSNPLLTILDVRTQNEYNSGHIRNTKLIPHTEIEDRISELDEDRETVVYCGSGGRSASASQILVDHGFTQVYNMLGGILAWMGEDYPVYVRYSSIQQAINNARDGDTIFVSSGTYREHLVVNKSLSLVGENKDTTIIDGGGTGNVLLVKTVNNTFISDFTIRGSGCGCSARSGIYLQNSYNNSVTGNIVTDNGYGIQLSDSDSCTIRGNVVVNNDWPGIALYWSHRNIVTDNDIEENDLGVRLADSSDNVFIHNNIIDNTAQTDVSGENANLWDEGYPSGGNYWSDYNGADSNGDGIGDTPYTIDEKNQDSYPLMNPYVSPEEMRVLYYELMETYSSLLADYNLRNSTFHTLQSSYDSLLSNFESLNSTYNSINTTYNELRSKQEALVNELDTIRSQMNIFVATTVILLATTVYFAIRKSES
jgi:parallel beta-helix repeat protein